LRVYNGLYLANWELGRRDAAAEAFDRLVDFGLRQQQLAVKFLFRASGDQERALRRSKAGSGAGDLSQEIRRSRDRRHYFLSQEYK